MRRNSSIEKIISLSLTNWVTIVFLFAAALSSIFWIPFLFNFAVKGAEIAAIVMSAIAIAVSAYAAMTANRLRVFEILRGYRAARTMVRTDAHESLLESQKLLRRLLDPADTDKGRWNQAIDEMQTLERRYERKQELLPMLCTHFSAHEFVTVQALYLDLYRIFLRSDGYAIPKEEESQDAILKMISRRKKLRTEFRKAQKDALVHCQKLFPGELCESLVSEIERPIGDEDGDAT